MLRKTLLCHGFVSFVLVAPLALADDGRGGDSLQGEGYQLVLGKTYKHRRTIMRLLGKYAVLGERVPADVVNEHAGAIRFNPPVAAKRSFAKLGETANENPCWPARSHRCSSVLKTLRSWPTGLRLKQSRDRPPIPKSSRPKARRLWQLLANHVDGRRPTAISTTRIRTPITSRATDTSPTKPSRQTSDRRWNSSRPPKKSLIIRCSAT